MREGYAYTAAYDRMLMLGPNTAKKKIASFFLSLPSHDEGEKNVVELQIFDPGSPIIWASLLKR